MAGNARGSDAGASRRIGDRAQGVIPWATRHFVAIATAVGLLTYVAIYTIPVFDTPPIRSDGYSYYVYLPSWLIYGDPTLESVAADCCGGTYGGFDLVVRWPETGQWLNVHPIGVAVLMLPFFIAAHLLTKWSNLTPDGFSLYYQHAAGLAGLAYMLIGLAILRQTLLRYFRPGVVLAALVTITFGTNLFHYGTADATFSHAFAFFSICALVELTERWWQKPTIGRGIALGAIAGLVVLIRHVNVLFLLIVPLYGIATRHDIRSLPNRLWQRRRPLAAMTVTAAIVLFPQLLIYKRATTHWLVSPYDVLGLGLDFASPHLFGVLFSPQKGLFFWSPALLLAVAGMATRGGIARTLWAGAIVVLAIDTYVIASFTSWQFAGSYGHRAFTDGLGIICLFLASFFEWTADRWRVRAIAAVATALAVMLSIAQMIQYWLRIIPMWDTTWQQYVHVFLRFR